MNRFSVVRNDEKGQSMIEFALIFPFLIIFILGIVQFGMVLSAQIAVTNAAREGARAAVVGTPLGDNPEAEGFDTVYGVVNYAMGNHGYVQGILSIDPINNTKENLGEPITVTIKGLYVEAIVPIPKLDGIGFSNENLIDGKFKFNIIGRATMRHEYNPPVIP